MYRVVVRKKVLSGYLAGLEVVDTYCTRSLAREQRVAGEKYKGSTHRYEVISIETTKV